MGNRDSILHTVALSKLLFTIFFTTNTIHLRTPQTQKENRGGGRGMIVMLWSFKCEQMFAKLCNHSNVMYIANGKASRITRKLLITDAEKNPNANLKMVFKC